MLLHAIVFFFLQACIATKLGRFVNIFAHVEATLLHGVCDRTFRRYMVKPEMGLNCDHRRRDK